MSRSVSTAAQRPFPSLRAFAARRPVSAFCVAAVGLVLLLQTLLLVAGLVVLTILVAAYRVLRGRSLVRGTVPALAEPGSESLSRSGQAGDQRAAA